MWLLQGVQTVRVLAFQGVQAFIVLAFKVADIPMLSVKASRTV
jgi:hypothetical protein